MKTATRTFPTGLAVYEDKPYFTGNLLTYNDHYYIIGSGHKEFNPLKISDEDNYVLTLAAIARELDHQKITSAKVLLATGLPLTWMVKQQESYRDYLMQNRTVDFNFRDVDYHIELVDVVVFPQGYAAIADRLGDFRGVNILADIGNGTVCRFVNDVLHIRESGKDLQRRAPVQGAHREIIVLPLSHGELLFKISKGIKRVVGIEFLVIFPVAALHLTIVAGCVGTDQLVPDSQLSQSPFKQCFLFRAV
jgi:hypothetical protein